MGSGSKLPFCPFHLSIFVVTAVVATYFLVGDKASTQQRRVPDDDKDDNKEVDKSKSTTNTIQQQTKQQQNKTPAVWNVVFVLGGPGVGKGTQCTKYVDYCNNNNNSKTTTIKWSHLSAGELLRAERIKVDSILANEINNCISSGVLVKSTITCQLIENAMLHEYNTNGTTHYIIDGFPRSHDNATVWYNTFNHPTSTSNNNTNNTTSIRPSCIVHFVLHLICPDEIAIGRLLSRGQQEQVQQQQQNNTTTTSTIRTDDQNINVIRKRLQTFYNETEPVIQYYRDQYTTTSTTATTNNTDTIVVVAPNVYTIRTDQNVDVVFDEFKSIFQQHGF